MELLLATSHSPLAEQVLFWVFAIVGVGAGIGMVLQRNLVYAALLLVLNFFAISGLYLGLQSAFLSIVQIIVYAGAIMVLFLFVIMLIGVDHDDAYMERDRIVRVGATIGGVAVAAVLIFAVVPAFGSNASRCGDLAVGTVSAESDDIPCVGMDAALEGSPSGSVGVIADRMFTRYTFAFESAALLLTVATIGALLLGKRHDTDPDADQAWESNVVLPTPEEAEAALAGALVEAEVAEATAAAGQPDGEAAPKPEEDR